MDVRRLAAILAWVALSDARAAEWSVPASGEANLPLGVSRIVADGDGYVMAGTDIDLAPHWVRVAPDGGVRPSSGPSEIALDPGGTIALRTLGDDRFLVGPDAVAPDECRLRIADATGRVIATGSVRVGTCLPPPAAPHAPAARDATGGVWFTLTNATSWLRMQSDGVIRPVAVPPDTLGPLTATSLSPLTGESAAYALYPTAAGPRLAKAGADGTLAWSRSAPDGVRFRAPLATLANDDVLVAGETGTQQEGPLVLLRYSP